MAKVVLVGCGNVGMSYAYALVTAKNKVDELVLIDINQTKAEGEAMDLTHAAAYNSNRIKIKAGDYSECNDADLICICAGRNQEVGESRTDLIHKNYAVFKSIIGEVNKTKFDGIYLIATNPLDVMTYITKKLSGFPAHKVIGSGTTLDTARLRVLIGNELEINPANIHAYVIGEHGDSEFVPWSNAMIGLKRAKEYLSDDQCSRIQYDVRSSAYDIIRKKGSTCYGIGMCLLDITNAIFEDSNAILTVSAYNELHDIYFGMPTILNRQGVKETLYLELSQTEADYLTNSLEAIKSVIKQIK
ncbi:MAG: L-lactate dehydrogenase [Clostridiales bacterium]|nr:L-lactate dehydrogenase [Clostridiales bacterium]